MSDNLSTRKVARTLIVDCWRQNVRGKSFLKKSSGFDGEEGHWLEKQMNIHPNSDNAPDLHGHEQKKSSRTITFIDKQTSSKYFEGAKFANTSTDKLTKEKWWNTFRRDDRPDEARVGGWDLDSVDYNGQYLEVDTDNNINVKYNYMKDQRSDKDTMVSNFYKNEENHMIAQWNAVDLKKAIEQKFNKHGFYICSKDKNGLYNEISFGPPISFDTWINSFKLKKIYYDGYSSLTGRWRGTFRASKTWWNMLVNDKYN